MATREQEKKRILVVEDEVVVAMDLAANLEDLGYGTVGMAHSAEQAFREVQETSPDLVLMDILLQGGVDGIEAAKQICRRWDVPVIFVTANTDPEMIARAKAAGSYGFVSKPVRSRDLDATVGIALSQHKRSRTLFAERSWFTTMLASLSDAVIASDEDGYVRYMNAAAEEITGWSITDAVGLPIEAVYPLSTMENVPVHQCQLRKALDTWLPVPKERFLMHVKGDHAKPVQDAASPIIERGRLLGAVTIFRDITDLLKQERQESVQREHLEEQVQTASEALSNTRQQLQALSHHLITAQDDERARIARELHDDLGQRTALLGLKVQSLESRLPSNFTPELAGVRKDVSELADGLRDVSHQLHPSVLTDLGLAPALESLASDVRGHGQDIQLKIDTQWLTSIEVATALYRIAQEAIKNAQRHAEGSPIAVRLWKATNSIHLSIRDRGPGFLLSEIQNRGGLGLTSMQERARLVGGVLLLSAKPGHGTTVLVRVPIRDEPKAARRD